MYEKGLETNELESKNELPFSVITVAFP